MHLCQEAEAHTVNTTHFRTILCSLVLVSSSIQNYTVWSRAQSRAVCVGVRVWMRERSGEVYTCCTNWQMSSDLSVCTMYQAAHSASPVLPCVYQFHVCDARYMYVPSCAFSLLKYCIINDQVFFMLDIKIYQCCQQNKLYLWVLDFTVHCVLQSLHFTEMLRVAVLLEDVWVWGFFTTQLLVGPCDPASHHTPSFTVLLRLADAKVDNKNWLETRSRPTGDSMQDLLTCSPPLKTDLLVVPFVTYRGPLTLPTPTPHRHTDILTYRHSDIQA